MTRPPEVRGNGAPTAEERTQRNTARVAATLERLADFAARRAQLATEEAVYLAELARTADPGLAESADPSVTAAMATGFSDALAPPAAEPEYLNQAALAAMLNTHPRTIRRMELEGELPTAQQIGRLKRWRRSEVQAWLEHGRPMPRRTRR